MKAQRFTKAALGVAVIAFLTIGFMPGQIETVGEEDCAPALVAAMQRREGELRTGFRDAYSQALTELGNRPTPWGSVDEDLFPPIDGTLSANAFREEADQAVAKARAKYERDAAVNAYERAAARVKARFPEDDDRYATERVQHPCNGPARSLLIKVALLGAGFVAAVAVAEYTLMDGENKR